jgi:hypothetical protein
VHDRRVSVSLALGSGRYLVQTDGQPADVAVGHDAGPQRPPADVAAVGRPCTRRIRRHRRTSCASLVVVVVVILVVVMRGATAVPRGVCASRLLRHQLG